MTEYDDNTQETRDHKWSILSSRLKIAGVWQNPNSTADPEYRKQKVVKVSEFMYALAPFYNISVTIKSTWEN